MIDIINGYWWVIVFIVALVWHIRATPESKG
jgi:hypothetical protein